VVGGREVVVRYLHGLEVRNRTGYLSDSSAPRIVRGERLDIVVSKGELGGRELASVGSDPR
jgi:hypothetical protein